jgi:replicative DNA helicase
MALLSCFLQDPQRTGILLGEMGLSPEACHVPRNATILSEMLDMWQSGQPIDLVLLTASISSKGLLGAVGGPSYLTEVACHNAPPSNASSYAKIIQEKSQLRAIVRIGTEYSGRAMSEQMDLGAILDGLEGEVLAIRKLDSGSKQTTRQATIEAIDDLQRLYETRGAITGLSTGFKELDVTLDGMHAGEMIVVAARPGVGKSALMMNMAEHLAVDSKVPVGVFSLEMSTKELVKRLVASRAKLNPRKVAGGWVSEQDMGRLAQVASAVATAPLFIDDTSRIMVGELRAKALRMKQEHKIQALFVDYLQLCRADKDKKNEEVAEISASLKGLAKDMQIPVIALSQLSRAVESEDRRPRLSDLRESGAIEQDADVVLMLSRDMAGTEADLTVAKQRNGPLDMVPLTFLKEETRFLPRAFKKKPEEML